MQDSYERQMEKEADYVAFDTAMAAFTETENMAKNRTMSIGSSSDLDSFVSATDVSHVLVETVSGQLILLISFAVSKKRSSYCDC